MAYLKTLSTGENTYLVLNPDDADFAGKAPIDSPAFTGTPTAPTPTTGDDSTNIATTQFVQASDVKTVRPRLLAPLTTYYKGDYVVYNHTIYKLVGQTSVTTGATVTTPASPTWAEVGPVIYAIDSELGDMAEVDDADSDGKIYARKDGGWVEVKEVEWGNIVGDLSDQTDLQNELDEKLDAEYVERTGDIITFESETTHAIKDLKVAINPVQDLHGYSNPWPAAGGANQWDEDWEVGTIGPSGQNSNSNVNIRSKNYNPCIPSTTYYITNSVAGSVFFYDSGKTFINSSNVQNTTFTTPSNCYFFRFAINSAYGATYNHDIAVNYPSTVITYSPYSNICPISGWAGVDIHDHGKNLLNAVSSNAITYATYNNYSIDDTTGNVTFSGNALFGFIVSVKPNTTYTYSLNKSDSTIIYMRIREFSAFPTSWQDSNYIKQSVNVEMTTSGVRSINVTVSENTRYVVASIYTVNNTTLVVSNIQFELGSSPTAYEPYLGTIYPVSWENEAGTVYGGELDVTSGLLTATYGAVDLGGRTWNYNATWGNSTNSFYAEVANIAKKSSNKLANILCSIYAPVKADSMYTNGVNCTICQNSNGVRIVNHDYSNINTFKTAMSGIYLVYELATPITYQLTPTQVATLIGTNNLWADTGSSTVQLRLATGDLAYQDTVDYVTQVDNKPDVYTKTEANALLVEKAARSIVTYTESSMTATRNYVIGDLISVGDNLYRVTSNIANGSTITVGTNVTATTVNDELKSIHNDISDLDETKADIDGSYDTLTAGTAQQLLSSQFIVDKEPYTFRTSGGSVDIGNRENNTIVGGTVAWNQLVTTDTPVKKTVTDDIVHIEDAVAANVDALTVEINPVQNLRGQSAPYPAGAGKNLIGFKDVTRVANDTNKYLNVSDNYITVRSLGSGSSTAIINSTAMAEALLVPTLPAGTYTFSISSFRTSVGVNNLTTIKLVLSDGTEVAHNSSFTLTQETGISSIIYAATYNYVNGSYFSFYVQIESGTTATDYAPYDNICPISGHDLATIYDDPAYGGTILWNQIISLDLSVGWEWNRNKLDFSVSEREFQLSTKISNDDLKQVLLSGPRDGLALNHVFLAVGSAKFEGTGSASVEFAVQSNATLKCHTVNTSTYTPFSIMCKTYSQYMYRCDFKFRLANDAEPGNATLYVKDLQVFDLTLMFGETVADSVLAMDTANAGAGYAWFHNLFPNDYYEYNMHIHEDNVDTWASYNEGELTTVSEVNSNTYHEIPVSWQSSAGTVYGGEVNVKTGVLTVTHKSRTITSFTAVEGAKTYAYIAAYVNYEQTKGGYVDPRIICNEFIQSDVSYTHLRPYQFLSSSGVAATYYFALPLTITSKDEANAWAAAHPITYIYRMATPETYQLTAQELATLTGVNNIWADTGDTTVTYSASMNDIVTTVGSKYLTNINETKTIVNGDGTTVSGLMGRDNIFDLTRMFGKTIADYVYGLESATAGTGIAWFKALFPKAYYEYNAGALLSVSDLVSHYMRGFNAWDEEWVNGYFDTGGNWQVTANAIASKNPIPVIPNTTYYVKCPDSASIYFTYWTEEVPSGITDHEHFIARSSALKNTTFTTPANCHAIHFNAATAYGATYKGDICINISWSGYRNGEYESYKKWSYPLDSSLSLRGLPKLDTHNNLYYDGDTYESDGKVTRKYGIVDLGTLTWSRYDSKFLAAAPSDSKVGESAGSEFAVCSKYRNCWKEQVAFNNNTIDKAMIFRSTYVSGNNIGIRDTAYSDAATFKAAMSGVYLVYELATPTVESADPYTNPQVVDDFGTEEYVSSSQADMILPVGHVTQYLQNLRDKLQHLPSLADEDGTYIISQNDKSMSLEAVTLGTLASKNDASSDSKQYVRKNAGWEDLAPTLATKGTVIENTVSGSLITIEDGAEGYPVKKLVVGIEPVQDLHGYDNPWPAGGGTNIYNGEYIQGRYIDIETGEIVTTAASWTVNETPIPCQPNTEYRFIYNKAASSGSLGYLAFYDAQGNYLHEYISMNQSSIYNAGLLVTTPANCYFMNFYCHIKWFTEASLCINYPASVTSWSSYANICPIRGWTQANVTKTGKNLCGGSISNMAILALSTGVIIGENSTYRAIYARVKSGETYTVSRKTIESNRFRIGATVEVPAQGISCLELANTVLDDNKYSITVTIPEGYNYIFVYLSNQSDNCTASNYQVEVGSVSTSIVAGYNIEITIPLGSTVYGGTVDLTTGVMRIDTGTFKTSEFSYYNFTALNDGSGYYVYKYNAFPNSDAGTYSKSETHKRVVPSGGMWENLHFGEYYATTSLVITVPPECNTASLAKTYLNTIDSRFIYLLTSPIEVTLTAHELSTLLGMNHIWADTGDIVNLEYRSDTKLYIDQKIAESTRSTRKMIAGEESSMVATKNYTVGEYLWVGDDLYKVTANIANGGTITVGTNVSKCTVGEQLKLALA